jgi:tRNA1Val (adenine37-N6)-methyltransferase
LRSSRYLRQQEQTGKSTTLANTYFRFKKFIVHQDACAMKVTTDSCFFGAWAAKELENGDWKVRNVLDIGTGTGLLSLMIAQKNNVEIDAVEIDAEAAAQARENADASPWKDRINIFNEDILSFQPVYQYDCIICNPPFYENELSSSKEKRNLAHHSEQLTIAQVLNRIKTHLTESGLFFLMFPFKRKEEVEGLFQQQNLYILNTVILQQSVKHPPFRVMVMGSAKKEVEKNSTPLSIWNEHQHYTKPFIDLLKDYYLYL